MPATLKTRPVRQSSVHGVSEATRIQLLFGANYFNEPDGYPEPFTAEVLAEMKRDWLIYRDSLLASYRVPKGGYEAWAVEHFESQPQPVRYRPQSETR